MCGELERALCREPADAAPSLLVCWQLEVAGEHADEVEIVDVTFDDAPPPGSMSGTCVGPVAVVAQ